MGSVPGLARTHQRFRQGAARGTRFHGRAGQPTRDGCSVCGVITAQCSGSDTVRRVVQRAGIGDGEVAWTPLSTAEPLLAGLGVEQRSTIAESLLEAVLDQVMVRGMFHVDLHPGNVLVEANATLGLLDFGSVGRIDGSTRTAIGRLMAALGRADSLVASDALLELVDPPDDLDERNLERAVGGLIVRVASPGTTSGVAAFSALFQLITSYRLAIPPQVAAVFRTFATLEGTLVVLDPGFDLLAEARELGRKRAMEAVEPGRARQTAEAELAALLPLVRRLPRRVDRIADAVEHGRVTLNVRLFAERETEASSLTCFIKRC